MGSAGAPVGKGDGPIRCLWLTKGLGRGGVERLLVDMYPLVDPSRYAVEVAYVLPWKNNYHAALVDAGATVHCLDGGRGDPRWLPRLRRLMAEGGYGVVHSHAPLPGVAARMLPLPVPRPAIVHTEHNVWHRYRWPTRLLNDVTYGRNQGVIAVSGSVADTIRPRGRGRAVPVRTVLHGTVLGSVRTWDPEGDRARGRRRSAVGLPPDVFLVGNVGNFTAKKDHANLLRAMAGPGPIGGAHLALVGLGPLADELGRTARDLGIAERVHFLGSRDDVFDLLPLFDTFCLSSEFEGFPIALVEAMATGLPCVSTSVGGVPEILVDGVNGLLVPSKDPAALRHALEAMLSEPDLARRCGLAARHSAGELDLRHAVRALEEVYDRALEGPTTKVRQPASR